MAAVLGGGAALAAASPAHAEGCLNRHRQRAEPDGREPVSSDGNPLRQQRRLRLAGQNEPHQQVTEQNADGYAARVYVYWAQQYTGAIAVDDTSNAGKRAAAVGIRRGHLVSLD